MRHRFVRSLVTALALSFHGGAHAQFADLAGPTGFDLAPPLESLSPHRLTIADLDGDADGDLVAVTRHHAVPRLVVRRNRGDGTFAEPILLDLASGGRDVVAGDVDGDGDTDLVVAEGGALAGNGQTVAVFENQGGFQFALSQRFTAGQGPYGVDLPDLDGDGDRDVVVALYGANGTGNTVRAFRNDAGVFSPGPSAVVSAAPFALRAGDFDQDGRDDVVCGHEGSDRITLLYASPSSFGFRTPILFDLSAQTAAGPHGDPTIEVVDLDADGDLDVAFSDRTHQRATVPMYPIISVLTNDGTGKLSAGGEIFLGAFGESPIGMDFADVTNDGFPDVLGVTANFFVVVESQGAGTFAIPTVDGYVTADGPTDVAAHDADGDGDLDALVLSEVIGSVGVRRFENGQLADVPPFYAGPQEWMDAADVDLDGDLDIAGGGDFLYILRNAGDGTFPTFQKHPSQAFGGPTGVVLRDMNTDGLPDVLLGVLGGFNILFNQGGGSFGNMTTYLFPHCGLNDIEAADFDNDQDLDLVLPEFLGCPSVPFQRIFVFANDGQANFTLTTTLHPTGPVSDSLALDLDQDGRMDLVVCQNSWVEIFYGNGDLTFQPAVKYATDWGPQWVAAEDFDQDGRLDLVTANFGDNFFNDGIQESISVLLADGQGGFLPHADYAASYESNVQGIATGDADADGDVDIFAGNGNSADCSLFRNRATGRSLRGCASVRPRIWATCCSGISTATAEATSSSTGSPTRRPVSSQRSRSSAASKAIPGSTSGERFPARRACPTSTPTGRSRRRGVLRSISTKPPRTPRVCSSSA